MPFTNLFCALIIGNWIIYKDKKNYFSSQSWREVSKSKQLVSGEEIFY